MLHIVSSILGVTPRQRAAPQAVPVFLPPKSSRCLLGDLANPLSAVFQALQLRFHLFPKQRYGRAEPIGASAERRQTEEGCEA